MQQQPNESSVRNNTREAFLWDLLIALRLYTIVLFILLPAVLISIHIFYLQPFSIIILGISVLLILRFVLFEPRTDSERFLKISLAFLIPCAGLIYLNFLIGLIIQIYHYNLMRILFPLVICIVSPLYFLFTVKIKNFRVINAKLISWKENWSSKGKGNFMRKNIFICGSLGWLCVSLSLFIIPYPVYIQTPPENIDDQTIGIWVGRDYNISDDSMLMLADEDVYFVTTVKKDELNNKLENWLNRCKDYDIDVHISMSVKRKDIYGFVNVWTIETLMDDMDDILEWLDDNNFIGEPVSTAVYDMECLVSVSFNEYLFLEEAKGKLSEYYELQQEFQDFNEEIRDDYELDVQICGDFMQGYDHKDQDDDVNAFNGLLLDPKATRSYMIYRKDVYEMNYVLDTCRFLEKGDTIILNSWKFEGCKCWEDIDCVIEEARLILGYPKKKFNLEIWNINNFVESYGIDGLHDFIEDIKEKPADWPAIIVWNKAPSSIYIDMVFYLYTLLDLYVPIIKLIFLFPF